jgi:lipopolysaccharide transport system permease protein
MDNTGFSSNILPWIHGGPVTITQFLSLADLMARLSLKADAQRFYLGYLWWVLEPLLYIGVFYVVFYHLLGTNHPDFLLFLAVGKFTFIWFAKSINQAGNSLLANRGLIANMDLPKALFPIAQIQEGLYKQLSVFFLLLAVLLFDGRWPTLNWLWILPIMVTQYLLIVFCSLIAALLVCWQRDFTLVINLGVTFLLFVSGVFWDVQTLTSEAAREAVLTLNPLAFLLDAYRSVWLRDAMPDVAHLLVLATSLIALNVGILRVYGVWSRAIARRIIQA